jgi:hypothetical protein
MFLWPVATFQHLPSEALPSYWRKFMRHGVEDEKLLVRIKRREKNSIFPTKPFQLRVDISSEKPRNFIGEHFGEAEEK